MYRSLKKWLNVPVQLVQCVSIDSAGDATYAAPIDTMCYPERKTTVVTDAKGNEVVSNITLYMEGDTWVKESDEIVFEGEQRPIKAIGVFYEKGTPDVKVVYV